MASRNDDCPGQSPVDIFQLRSGVLGWPAHPRFPHFLRSISGRWLCGIASKKMWNIHPGANPCKPRCWFTETSSFLKHPVFSDVNRPCLSCSTLHMIPDANALAEDPFDAGSWMGQCLDWVGSQLNGGVVRWGNHRTRGFSNTPRN